MPGYRLANADEKNLNTKYFCNSCKSLLRDAIQTSCGHFYCNSCLQHCFNDGNSAPPVSCAIDGEVLHEDQIFEDRFMRREILGLKISCTFQDDGCTWTGEVRQLEDHTSMCEFQEIPCVFDACGLMVKRGDLSDHLRTECRFRLEKCIFCDKEVSHNTIKEHLRSDHNYLHYQMDNLRDVVDDVLHVLDHLRNEQRDLRERQRDLRDGQRDLRDGQRDLQDRLQVAIRELQVRLSEQDNLKNGQDDLENAIQLVQETLTEIFRSNEEQKMEGELVTDKLSNLEDKLNRALSRLDGIAELARESREPGDVEREDENSQETAGRMDQRDESNDRILATRRLTNVENRIADHDVLVEEARRDVGNVKRQLDTNQESVRRQERRIESIEHTLALRNVTLADLEEYVRQQEFSSHDGQLLWKISDYARRRNNAVTGQQVSLWSPCFSTSRYGYKMCARLYLNGDGMGRGTHISVFFVIMRGQYDALLCWPFRQKVTFMLLDQDNVEHVIDAFRPDPSSPSFQRPRRETNIASGCPMFCSLAELNNHAYVRDDTMFLKIIVDTSD